MTMRPMLVLLLLRTSLLHRVTARWPPFIFFSTEAVYRRGLEQANHFAVQFYCNPCVE